MGVSGWRYPPANCRDRRRRIAVRSPGGPVPVELQRTLAEVGATIDAHLTLGANVYTTQSGGSASGAVVVSADYRSL